MTELSGAHAALLATVPEPTGFSVETADVDYAQGGTALRGFLARPSAGEGRIGVLIMHDWFGVADTAIMRARMLARLGYVAFAADIFGADTRPTPEQAPHVAGSFYGDPELTRARAAAGLEQLRAQPGVDPGRIVVIGYCFGGFVALELARTGADVAGTVTFHGSLKSDRPQEAANISGRVLVLTGSDDPVVPDTEIADFVAALREGEVADWQVHLYGGAQHSFTVPGADHPPAVYDAAADRRSWAALLDFLGEFA